MDIYVKNPSKPTTNCHRKFLNRLYEKDQSSSSLGNIVQSESVSTGTSLYDHGKILLKDQLSTIHSTSYVCLPFVVHVLIFSHVFSLVIHVIFSNLSAHWLHFILNMCLKFGTCLAFHFQDCVIILTSVAQFFHNKSKWIVIQDKDIEDNHKPPYRSANSDHHINTSVPVSNKFNSYPYNNRNRFQANDYNRCHGNIRRKALICSFLLFCNLGLVTSSQRKKVKLAGYGASFPKAVYSEWINSYVDARSPYIDLDMTYTDTGSSTGIKLILGMYCCVQEKAKGGATVILYFWLCRSCLEMPK